MAGRRAGGAGSRGLASGVLMVGDSALGCALALGVRAVGGFGGAAVETGRSHAGIVPVFGGVACGLGSSLLCVVPGCAESQLASAGRVRLPK